MKCPKCGEEMEEGSLRAIKEGMVAFFWGAKRRSFFKDGEKIRVGFFHVDLNGFRCTKCTTLVLNYGEEKDK